VTGERIRDKIAASKKKGMWLGGDRSSWKRSPGTRNAQASRERWLGKSRAPYLSDIS
jgi:DNA invertase Pin-like site-specific DNA recombinase